MTSMASRITTLLTSIGRAQVAALSPVERQALTDQCRRLLKTADAADTAPPPKGCILDRLNQGERAP